MAQVAAPQQEASGGRSSSREETVAGWVAISPWVIGFIIFTAGPIIASLYLSFTEYDFIRPIRWTGLDNYRQIFTQDIYFTKSLVNSIIYMALYVPLHVGLALGVALLLHRARRARGIFRTLFYLPAMTPGVATAILWIWILNPQVGIVNQALRILHLPAPAWTVDPFWMKPAVVITSLWAFGGAMIIFLAGLQGIPATLYEAAEIDGANAWQRFWNVTVPQLSPVIFFIATIAVISSLQVFTQGYVMFDQYGGNENSALFYIMYLFQQAFQYFHLGYASALAWILFLVIAVLTALQFVAARKWVYYETTR
ncbi:MAG TPA: sugar ABC transporter permease [Thermomicrobiales bacterium]|nr:sugar ABC transporter permease [Thermomicrobiales bacterium]